MKIHIWCQSYAACPGGIQTFTRFVVRALGEVFPGAEICVFAKYDGSGPINVREGGDVFASTRDESATQKETDIRVLGFGKWPGPVRAVAFAFGVVWHAIRAGWMPRRGVPTIIISTHVNFAPVAGIVKRFVGHVPFCVIGHGIEVWEIPNASVRKALREADQLVAVSDFTRQRMARVLEINPERIDILPNTFDADRFQPGSKPSALLQRYGLTPEQPVILTVARLAATEQYKGYDQVLRALPAVSQRFSNVRYVIVGDGPDKDRLGALSKELGVEDKVVFAGYVPNEELAGHYSLCDVFAMPSKGEGFGIVFLEALSCGKPVIAGNKDASVEAVLGGKLGTLVDPDDVAAIANAITRVLSASSGQQSAVPPSPGFGVAGSDQRGDAVGTAANTAINSTELRREVIAAYGFEQFRQRVGEIVRKIVDGRHGDFVRWRRR